MREINDQIEKLNRKVERKKKRISSLDHMIGQSRYGYIRRRKQKDERDILRKEIKKLQEEVSHLELQSKAGK
jgi:DNA repair exonuclease SbcCD ATPase subunit